MKTRALIHTSFVTAVVGISVLAQQSATVSNPSASELSGEYAYSSGFVGAIFTLLNDGHYKYSTFSDCCDAVWSESGTYELTGATIHFKVINKRLDQYNLLDPEQAKEAFSKRYGKAVEAMLKEIRTEYDMHLVRWGNRRYLIEPNHLDLFTAAVNFGVEPRKQKINGNYLTNRFFLQNGDEQKIAEGRPALPEPWNAFLEGSPIKATITTVEMRNQYQIDKGSADHVRVGMYFLGAGVEPDFDNLLQVISVEEGLSRLKASFNFRPRPYKVGDLLTNQAVTKSQ